MNTHHLLATCVVAALLHGCGGSNDSTTSVDINAFQSDGDKQALAGDWPKMNYTVFNQQDWEAAWAERRASLNCTRSANANACARVSPPTVDFSTSTVVGVTLGRSFAFPASGRQATASQTADVLTVEYLFEQLATPIPEGTPAATQFWVVRARAGTVKVIPAGAA